MIKIIRTYYSEKFNKYDNKELFQRISFFFCD